MVEIGKNRLDYLLQPLENKLRLPKGGQNGQKPVRVFDSTFRQQTLATERELK